MPLEHNRHQVGVEAGPVHERAVEQVRSVGEAADPCIQWGHDVVEEAGGPQLGTQRHDATVGGGGCRKGTSTIIIALKKMETTPPVVLTSVLFARALLKSTSTAHFSPNKGQP